MPSWHAQGLHLLPVLILLSILRLDLFNCFLHISFPDENVCVFLVADTWLHSHHLDAIILILDYQLKRTHFADGHLVPFFITEPDTLLTSSLPVRLASRPIKRRIKEQFLHHMWWAGIAQSALGLGTGWTVRGSNPDVGKIYRTCADRPWSPPSLLYNGYRVFPGGKAAGAWR